MDITDQTCRSHAMALVQMVEEASPGESGFVTSAVRCDMPCGVGGRGVDFRGRSLDREKRSDVHRKTC